jgi:alpha-methylacyl-CoA racemase
MEFRTVSISSFLQGIRVLDLSRHLPGPLATLMLADMGAEVLKIEPPYGDELRSVGPEGPSGRSAYFDAANAGKRCRQLDLRIDSGRDELLRLVESADVVVESFRPGVLDCLGVGFATMRARNPRLVCCALNGFGVGGPLSDKAAHDINYLALAGTLSGTGLRERPMFFYPPVADCSGAIFAVSAIVGALFQRTRTGHGCEIDLALADAVMPFHLFQLADLTAHGKAPDREAGLMNGGAACYRIYPTADGCFVSLGAIERKFWARFCEAAGRPEWIERQYEPTPQNALVADVQAFFLTLASEQAVALFANADCCFAPVLCLGQAIASPHHRARGLVRKGADGQWQALFPALVDGVPPRLREPLVDEDAAREHI